MYRIGQEEIDAVARLIKSGKLFRYREGSETERFETRYAKYLGVKHVNLTSSGTTALTSALMGLGIGPGDEVIVPSHTYMATAVAVLAAGAIPVIIDVDESITMDPHGLADAIGPRTRAVIPVHMWGLPCNMAAILRIARRHKLLVIEDACQGVGGGYEGEKLGSMGHAGAFSFNYYKNMTCGEGGAVVTNDGKVFERARCAVDCCRAYWKGSSSDLVPFTANGSRASEIEGAILNVQLGRLDEMIRTMRRQKKRTLRQTASSGLSPIPANSLDYECASHTLFQFPSAAEAEDFAKRVGGTVCGQTGRHTFTEWQQVLMQQGAHHPALNPYLLPQNKACRRNYPPDLCRRSLDILGRTVMILNHPDRTDRQLQELIDRINAAGREVLGTAVAAGNGRTVRQFGRTGRAASRARA